MASERHDDGIFAFMLGMLVGAAAGGVAAVLFAPKTGKEFRQDVKGFVKSLPNLVETEMSETGKSRQFIDRTRYQIESKVEKAQQQKQAKRLVEARYREEAASGVDYN